MPRAGLRRKTVFAATRKLRLQPRLAETGTRCLALRKGSIAPKYPLIGIGYDLYQLSPEN